MHNQESKAWHPHRSPKPDFRCAWGSRTLGAVSAPPSWPWAHAAWSPSPSITECLAIEHARAGGSAVHAHACTQSHAHVQVHRCARIHTHQCAHAPTQVYVHTRAHRTQCTYTYTPPPAGHSSHCPHSQGDHDLCDIHAWLCPLEGPHPTPPHPSPPPSRFFHLCLFYGKCNE